MSSGADVLPPLSPALGFHGPPATVPAISDHVGDRPPVNFSVVVFPGKGMGLTVNEFVKRGQTIIEEKAAVIGPKQTSPLVCVECFKTFPGVFVERRSTTESG
jgi:hypothetical protein